MKKANDRTGYLFSKGYSNYVFSLLFLLFMFEYADQMVVNSIYFGMASIVFVTTTLIVWLPMYFEKELSIKLKTAGSLAGTVFLLKGTIQIAVLFLFGVIIMTFLAGAVAVTQDVIHPGLRATSYAIAVTVQNLLGSTAPVILGKTSDLSNIRTAMQILPFVLLIGALVFYLGSRYYLRDMEKVAKINLEVA